MQAYLRFLDDINLIARQFGNLQHLVSKVEEVSNRYGLEISKTKTEWLVVKREESINISGEQLI